MIRNTIMIALSVLVLACNTPQESSETTFSADGYLIEEVPGTSLQKAVKRDANGNLIEQGYLLNGVQTGAWTTFHVEKNIPQRIINYVNGTASGIYLELNERGQVELMANYENNQLDGPWGKYKFGRPVQTASYKAGKLDGLYQEYNDRDGKIRKSITYKNGEYDGPYRFYNDKGEVTVEYVYENGEKVSGGMLNEGVANDPK